MRRGALLEQHPVPVHAALIAVEANAQEEGFRQRDLRFYIELFSNWLQSTLGASSLTVHNAQTQRLLELLVLGSLARRLGRRRPPRYRILPAGLLATLEQLVAPPRLGRLEEFFLVYHLLSTYGGRIQEMLARERLAAPMRVDLGALLDVEALVTRRLTRVDLELKKLELRIQESNQTSKLAVQMFSAGRSLEEVVDSVQRRYPYELNSQRPLSELIGDIPPRWRRFELDTAAARRAKECWAPARDLLVAYREILTHLLPGRR